METRRFGRTGHMSTVGIFGGVALGQITQLEADQVMEKVIAAGVNHIDIAPSYGKAEERIGPWLERERERFFLGCKTTNRTKEGAAAELRQSLLRLRVPNVDLYQFHAVTTMEELDLIFQPGGAFEAVKEAREAGLTKYIGITGHGINVPAIFLEALRRYDFDSVLFPVNHSQFTNPTYRANAEELLRQCKARDVGIMAIKSAYKARWAEGEPHKYHPWYEPYDTMDKIQSAVNFVLSHDVTGICTVGDPVVLNLVLQACENYKRLSQVEIEDMISTAGQEQAPLFA